MLTKNAILARQYLNGVVCLYKPARMSLKIVRKVLLNKLCDDLNSMDCREPRKYVHISGNTTEPLHIAVEPNYADHPLVSGPRYLPEDMKAKPLKNACYITSGLCLMGVNEGIPKVLKLRNYNSPSTYHIVGELGKCTENALTDGRILFKFNYEHIRKAHIDKAVLVIQANHQKNLLNACGHYPHSQKAYEVLAAGLVRPANTEMPVCYSIKCIDINLPYFTVEMVTANESESYLLSIITDIGRRIKNMSATVSIRCIRHAFFTLEDALLLKHWQLQYVLHNMKLCQEKMNKNKAFETYLSKIAEEEKHLIENSVYDMDDDITDDRDDDMDDDTDSDLGTKLQQ